MKKAFVALAAAFCMAAGAVAAAQDFPNKTVRILIPYAAGTGPDVFTRMLGERLGGRWGHSVINESRPGASGFIAIEALKKAAPDGHELLLASNGHTSRPVGRLVGDAYCRISDSFSLERDTFDTLAMIPKKGACR